MIPQTRLMPGFPKFRSPDNHWVESGANDNLLFELLGNSLLLAEDWERLSTQEQERLRQIENRNELLSELVRLGLLTPYQASRISSGNLFGLVLGNFRVLERLGAGGMAIVYKAEHIEMRHLVAIKVLQLTPGDDPRLESRFSSEMRIVARLRHPNIVAAMDAGRVYPPDPDHPVLWYLVMEYVPGENLEEHVRARGPLPVPRACNLIHQVACALSETHKLHLVHRDIKPSNILVTPEEQAKLLDFGLSRHVPSRVTQPGTVLGTLDYMAPEQARDASQVDIRADIYGLGGTLFWTLTGRLPFPADCSDMELLARRLTQQPPSIRSVIPDLPIELDALVRRMMALRPEDRPSTPQEVMQALVSFLRTDSSPEVIAHSVSRPAQGSNQSLVVGARPRRLLVVDDEAGIRQFCRHVMRFDRIECTEASDGQQALQRLAEQPVDLMLVDINMPILSGVELLRTVRANPPCSNLKIIMFSGQATSDEMAEMLLAGADDYLTKPFSVPQLRCRVQAALRLKEAQDRSEQLKQHLLSLNAELENHLSNRTGDLMQMRSALVLSLARLVQMRESDTTRHFDRMSCYCRILAEHAAQERRFANTIDNNYVEMLSCCAPLHDIGKVGLPDHILLKPGKLTSEERLLMQTHTTLPAAMLAELAETYTAARAFLLMASDIIRHHHERYDGSGYPDRLSGESIPLAARIVAIADVYDALRSRRSWKPPLSHLAAVQVMTEASAGHFDPSLLQVFRNCASELEQVFKELPG